MRRSSLAIIGLTVMTLLAAGTAHALVEGRFFFGDRSVKVEELERSDVHAFLAEDWAKFDHHVEDATDMFAGKMKSIDWHLEVTPPFPTNWPPQKLRSVTYYAYAEYQKLFMHGPALSRSAPWAKVVLNEGMPAAKVILANTINAVAHGEGSVPISKQLAERKTQIIKDGEAHLRDFVSWRTVPDDEAAVKAIREYYCQWALTNRTADLIRDRHQAFFEWLSCPPRTRIPVLP